MGENLGSHLGSHEVVFAFQDTEAGGTIWGCGVTVRLELLKLKTQGEDGSFFSNWEIQGREMMGGWLLYHHQNHEIFFCSSDDLVFV